MPTQFPVLARDKTAPKLAVMQTLREETAPNRLREQRNAMGLSQQELGAQLGERLGKDNPVTQQQIAKWENGGELKLSTLRVLADILQCAEQDIIGKPVWPSTEGWTSARGGAPRANAELLQRCIVEAQAALEQTRRQATPDRLAALVAEFYDAAAEQSARYGIPVDDIDLRTLWRAWRIIQN